MLLLVCVFHLIYKIWRKGIALLTGVIDGFSLAEFQFSTGLIVSRLKWRRE